MDDTKRSFGEVLTAAFMSLAFWREMKRRNRPAIDFRIGDGSAVFLGDLVEIPAQLGHRGGEFGTVKQIDEEGVGLHFKELRFGIRNEFFEWGELAGAFVIGHLDDRERKRESFMPPIPNNEGS